MKTTTNASAVPLARDGNGNIIQLPDEAATWGVRRHTGGRPRNVMGIDRKALRLPLDATIDDIEAMLGPGTYRLDLLDDAGAPLAVTVPVMVGSPPEERRNGVGDGDEESRDETTVPVALPTSGSDMRLLLEANVRAMQLSFNHQQRSLETSLRVVDTLRDGVKVLAEAQAGWIKALAETKSIDVPRNGAPWWYQSPPAKGEAANEVEASEDEDSADDDEEYDEEDDRPLTAWDHVYGITHEVLGPLMPLVSDYCRMKFGIEAPRNAASTAEPEAAPRKARPPGRPPGVPTSTPGVNPMALMAKLNEAKKLLTPEELHEIGHRMTQMTAAERERWTSELSTLSVEDAVARIREYLVAESAEPAA